MSDGYKIQDSMALWWLGESTGLPHLIGQVFLADGNRKVGLE